MHIQKIFVKCVKGKSILLKKKTTAISFYEMKAFYMLLLMFFRNLCVLSQLF